MSMTYGVAAALTLDEFALWLNLRDVYWQREGRESFEAMALFGGLLAIGLLGEPFFSGIFSRKQHALNAIPTCRRYPARARRPGSSLHPAWQCRRG